MPHACVGMHASLDCEQVPPLESLIPESRGVVGAGPCACPASWITSAATGGCPYDKTPVFVHCKAWGAVRECPVMFDTAAPDQTLTDDRADRPEPRWPALIAVLVVSGLYAALPASLAFGPRWVFAAI